MTYDEWKAHNPADEEESPAEAERREHEENPCPPESGCEVCWSEGWCVTCRGSLHMITEPRVPAGKEGRGYPFFLTANTCHDRPGEITTFARANVPGKG